MPIDKLEIRATEWIEKAIRNTGWFRVVHDGSGLNEQSGEETTYVTRRYRMYLDGIPVNTWLKFRYNLRDGYADVDVRIRDSKVRPSEQELSARKLVKSIEKSSSGMRTGSPTWLDDAAEQEDRRAHRK